MKYQRSSQTHVERMTDEKIIVGANRVRRLVEERGDTREVLWVDGDQEPDDEGTRHPHSARLPLRSDALKQLGSS